MLLRIQSRGQQIATMAAEGAAVAREEHAAALAVSEGEAAATTMASEGAAAAREEHSRPRQAAVAVSELEGEAAAATTMAAEVQHQWHQRVQQ